MPGRVGDDYMENNAKLREISAILDQNPVCVKIVSFFLQHKFAMDNARGIAEWWIGEDVESTQNALYQLASCGVVVVRSYAGVHLYSFTTDTHLQAHLQELLRQKGLLLEEEES